METIKLKNYTIEYEITTPEKDNYLYNKCKKIIYYDIKKNTNINNYWSTGGCIEYKGKETINKIIENYKTKEDILYQQISLF
jgi:hypothetical protein